MPTLTKKQPLKKWAERTTPGFSILITETTDLGMAMLIAENEEGDVTHPVAVVSTIAEAHDIAGTYSQDLKDAHMRGEDVPICPYEFKVWARGLAGRYCIAATFPPF